MTNPKTYINPKLKVVRKSNIFLLSILLLLILAVFKIYNDVFAPNVTLKYNEGKSYVFVSKRATLEGIFIQLDKGYFLENLESF
jgi:hypothetical protein